MRRAVGRDYPIFYRLGAQEKRPGGITVPQSRAFATELQTAGVDAFDVSIGMPIGQHPSPGPRAKMGTYAHLAKAIKQSVHVPVMAVGRLHCAETVEAVLSAGHADLIGVGRQLLADPQWPAKILNGRGDTIVACTACNTCFTPLHQRTWKPSDRICNINPRAGREIDTEAASPKTAK
jgi:2,4-dienoyl-CoA reductase (NADPH2)